MMKLCQLLVIALAFTHSISAQSKSVAATKYNLIAIVTDDQAPWSIGAYGNRESRTPNMDRLAREGARFTNAFIATPVCSPSRATFLTGRYGTELGITEWISPDEAASGIGLPPATVTWPEVLQKNGYRTALIGKWHLGSLPQFHPTRHGYDLFYGFLGGGNQPINPTLEVAGRDQKLTGSTPDLLTDEAMRFIADTQDKPFAVSLHYRAPHTPYGPVPEEDSRPFKDLDPTIPEWRGLDVMQVKRWTREYYASVHSVDRNLGRLLEHLDKLDLTRRTIMLFTSDHGYMIGHHGSHTKGNAFYVAGGVNGPRNPNLFDDSLRIPLLIRWPGVVSPGTEIRELISSVDTFASVIGMLGHAAPAKMKQHGMDYSPLLRGQQTKWRDAIFAQYDMHEGALAYMRAVRTEEWKLVRYYRATALDRLWNLKSDPGETKNLYNDPQYRAVRDQLQERLTAWMRSIDDPILRDQKKY
jgi:uncharacterized sulfatase